MLLIKWNPLAPYQMFTFSNKIWGPFDDILLNFADIVTELGSEFLAYNLNDIISDEMGNIQLVGGKSICKLIYEFEEDENSYYALYNNCNSELYYK